MASGIPVLASAIPGFTGIISHDQQGLLQPPGEPEAQVAALSALLDNPIRWRRIAKGGLIAARRHGWSRVVAGVLDVYDDAIARWRMMTDGGCASRRESVAG